MPLPSWAELGLRYALPALAVLGTLALLLPRATRRRAAGPRDRAAPPGELHAAQQIAAGLIEQLDARIARIEALTAAADARIARLAESDAPRPSAPAQDRREPAIRSADAESVARARPSAARRTRKKTAAPDVAATKDARGAETGAASPAARPHVLPDPAHGEPHTRIYALADAGHPALEIAETLGLPLEEVELIARLRALVSNS